MSVEPRRRLFTVEDFHAMARAGVLTEDDRVELIEGEIVEMTPIGSRHAACVKRLNQLFGRATSASDVILGVQDPVVLSDLAEPQPDLVLLRPRADFYAERHPRPADVLLLVEVADASVDYDREHKLPLYARAGVPETWLVDLGAGAVEVHRKPSAEGYREVHRPGGDATLRPVELPDLQLRVEELLG